jgi:nucleoid-associated protein YgaU
MARTSTTRIFVWSLALVAAAGAALSLDRLLRERPLEADAVRGAAAILPSPPRGQDQSLSGTVQSVAKTVQAAAKNVDALVGSTGLAGRGDEARPAFDVARIEPSGDAVIAGRAAPGASVELLRNGEPHDRVMADASGQFAMVPPRLPPGDSELTLRSRLPDGRIATSKESVVVALQADLKDRPVVALMTPDKPSVVLSKPAASTPGSTPGSTPPGSAVVVDAVETEPGGKLFVSGRSSPRAAVRLYLNDSYQASTTAAANGRFAFTTMNEGIRPGSGYRVRLDEVDPGSGAIRSRAEVPFEAASAASASLPAAGSPTAVTTPKASTAIVSRGDSLWRISRATYGDGARYTVIYDANHNQIRNPDRIYPGQVFVLPDKAR